LVRWAKKSISNSVLNKKKYKFLTNIDTGLNQSEVTQRRSYHGFNEFEISKEEPLWKKYLGEVCVKDQIYYCFFSTAKSFSTDTSDTVMWLTVSVLKTDIIALQILPGRKHDHKLNHTRNASSLQLKITNSI
jgi:magnesium-transporting ATPase (P-type)